MSIAEGNVKRFKDEDGKGYPVTPKQREKWARIAAYAVQRALGKSLSNGIVEAIFFQYLGRYQL
jgi:hypothetical protein